MSRVDVKYEAHPYALLLPALTDDEYKALKADIADNGILYPVILDEANLVLDGVHRIRIAGELEIDPPVSVHSGLDDERKLHLAVGLNMRRRHLDADKRRALVRNLAEKEGMSVRKIAAVTGWSKSTVDRDLKASPFESTLSRLGHLQELEVEDDKVREVIAAYAGLGESMFGWADQQWKRGNWPPVDDEEVLSFMVALRGLMNFVRGVKGDPDLNAHVLKLQTDPAYRARCLATPKSSTIMEKWRQDLAQMGRVR